MKQTQILTAVLLLMFGTAALAKPPVIDEKRIDALIAEQAQGVDLKAIAQDKLKEMRHDMRLNLQRMEVLKDAALAEGLDKDESVKLQKQNFEASFYASQYVSHLGKTLVVNDEDIQKLYQQVTREIKLQQAAFPSKDDAIAAQKKLVNGMSFSDLIATLPNQLKDSPDFINPQDLPAPIAMAISSLAKGEIIKEPFEYQGSFYLFKIKDARPSEHSASFEEMKPQLTQYQKQLLLNQHLEALFKKNDVQ